MSDKSYISLHMCSDAVKRGRLDWERCLVCESRCGYGKKLLKDKGVGYAEQEKGDVVQLLRSGAILPGMKDRIRRGT